MFWWTVLCGTWSALSQIHHQASWTAPIINWTKGLFWSILPCPWSPSFIQLSHPGPKREHWGVPRPEGTCDPSSVFWICLGISSELDKPETLPRGEVRKAQEMGTTSTGSWQRIPPCWINKKHNNTNTALCRGSLNTLKADLGKNCRLFFFNFL